MAGEVAIINDGWWDILKEAVVASAKVRPFETLVIILVTIIIVAITPIWLFFRHRHRVVLSKQEIKFEKIRRK